MPRHADSCRSDSSYVGTERGPCACVGRGSSGGAEIGDDGRAAFTAFWRAERTSLYRGLALTLGDYRLAGEAVDEAMARAWDRWGQVGGYDRPAAWVYRVALNWARSRRRKLRRLVVAEPATLDGATVDDLPDVDVSGLLDGLGHRDRELVVLRYFLQFTPTEIAGLQGTPVGTVKSRLHRALSRLRADVEELR